MPTVVGTLVVAEPRGTIGARLNYQSARIQLAQGNSNGGAGALVSALNYQRKASPGLFQIAMADKMYVAGAVTERLADVLYATVLREPRPRERMPTLRTVRPFHVMSAG